MLDQQQAQLYSQSPSAYAAYGQQSAPLSAWGAPLYAQQAPPSPSAASASAYFPHAIMPQMHASAMFDPFAMGAMGGALGGTLSGALSGTLGGPLAASNGAYFSPPPPTHAAQPLDPHMEAAAWAFHATFSAC
jgi:hypothetical protein